MEAYNIKFINDYPKLTYEKYLKNKILLSNLSKNYLDRFVQEKELDGEKLLFKESLDYYMLKELIDKTIYLKEFKKQKERYLNYLYNLIIKTNGLEIITNPFLIYLIENNIVTNFYDKNKSKQILNLYQDNLNKINPIINKINNNELITQKELNFISIYFGTKRDLKDKFYSKFITYLFTNLHKSTELKCQQESLYAIINYLPKEIDDPSIDKEYIRIVLTNIECRYVARYNQNKKHPYLNRIYFNNIDFISTQSINKTYENKQTDIDFIQLLVIAYHEINHQIQHFKSTQTNYSYEGIIYTNRLIIDGELSDYKDNYHNEQIEIDATRNAWINTKKFLKKHLHTPDSKKLEKKCSLNELGTKARRAIAKKKDISTYLVYTIDYDLSKISYFVKKDPNLLKLYPILKNIYDEQGNIKLNIVTINHQDPIINGYIEYMLNNHMLLTDNAYNQLFKDKNTNEINYLLNNIFNVIRQNISYINLIDNLINYHLYGDYKTDVSLNSLNESKKKYLINLYNNYLEFLNIISFIKEKSNLNIDSFWYKELSLYVINTINNHKYINIEKDINKLKSLTKRKD